MPTYSTAQFRQYVVDLLQQATGLTISIPTILSTAEYRGLVVDLLTVLAQGGGGGSTNATQLQGRNISATAPTSGQVLAWNGTVWIPTSATGSGTVTSVALSGGATGLTTSGGPITGSGTITLGGTLGVANGGTGATTLTGYVKGNGTAAFTASATVAAADVSGILSASNLPALSGDVTTTAGAASTTVVALRGRNVAATAPTSGQVLGWNGSTSTWEPITVSGGGGGTVTSIIAGTGLSGGTITTSGTIAVNFGTTTGTVTQGGTTVLKAGDSMTGALSIALNTNTAGLSITQSGNGHAFVIGQDLLVISPDGHLGIGINPNPSHALRVDTGGIFTQGGITFNDNSTQTTAGVTSLTGDVTTVGAGASAATVVALRGRSVASTAPTSGQVLAWNGTNWAPANAAGSGTVTSITAGTGLSGGTITTSGTIAVDFGTTAGTVAAGDDSRITGALQTSGGTMTGKLTAAASDTEAKLNVGSRLTTGAPSTIAAGDIWISNQGSLSYRDSTGPTSRAVATTSLSNTFNQPQTIGSTANAGAVLAVSNSGTREVVTISNTAIATSDAVVITNLGSGNSLVVNDETTPDSTRFAVANNGRVGIGVAPDASVALSVDSTGIKFSNGSTQTVAGITALTSDVTASGSGSVASTVVALQGRAVASTAPTSGQVLAWNGTAWAPTTGGGGGGITALTGDVTASGSGSVVATLANSGVTAANYGSSNAVAVLSIDAKGRVTSASNQTITPAGIGAEPAFSTLAVSKGGTGANTLTGVLKGNGTSAFTAAVAGTDYVIPSGSITGTASNVTGTVAIANGGTGQTTAANAINALVPAQTGNSGKFLTTNGSVVSWGDAAAGGGGVDVQQFLSSGTWTKSAGAKNVEILVIGQGLNGGAGPKVMAGGFGGTGGASGQLTYLEISADLLPSTLTITIPSARDRGISTFFYQGRITDAIAPSSEVSVTTPTFGTIIRAFSSGATVGYSMFNVNPSGQAQSVIGGESNGLESGNGTAAGSGLWGRNRSSTAGSGAGASSSFRIGAEVVPAGANSLNLTQVNGGNGTMRWSGTISESSSSGGSGGGSSSNGVVSMLAANGGDGGSWYLPVTLTSVATTSGSNVVSCASTSALTVGATLTGISGFPAGEGVYVNAILSSTTFNVVNQLGSVNATSSVSGQTVLAAFGVGGGGGGGGVCVASTPIFIYGVNLTNGSVTVTCSSTRGLLPQMSIYGNAGIPADAKVATLDSETQFTLTAAATADVTNGKAIVAGRGQVNTFSIASGGFTTTSISSTLGLSWGQGLIASTTALTPASSINGVHSHVAGFNSGNLVLSPAATAAATNAVLYAANAYGILDNVTTTSGSAVMTVPDTSVLSVGMLVQVVGSGNWSTVASSTSITSDVAITSSGAGSYFYGEGVKVNAGAMTASGTTTITAAIAGDVVAACTNKKFYYTKPNNQFVLPTWSTSNLASTRIKSIDSATQITLDKNALATTSGLSLMYAFTGGSGGIGACGGVKITTYK